MAYNNRILLTDARGRPIPQYYDTKTDSFKPLGDTLRLLGSIPEYGWFQGSTPPTPDEPGKLAFGISIDRETDKMTVKYWSGTEWRGLL